MTDPHATHGAIRSAYALALDKLRHLGLTVPTAADVVAELRRAHYVTSIALTREDCEALGLVLADAHAECVKYRRARKAW